VSYISELYLGPSDGLDLPSWTPDWPLLTSSSP
jgi:hypothetical protein